MFVYVKDEKTREWKGEGHMIDKGADLTLCGKQKAELPEGKRHYRKYFIDTQLCRDCVAEEKRRLAERSTLLPAGGGNGNHAR